MTEENKALTYSEYAEICESVGVPSQDILSEDEWNSPTDQHPDNLMRAIGKGGFGKLPIRGVVAGELASKAIDTIINEINDNVNMDEVPGKVADFVKSRFARRYGGGSDTDPPGGSRSTPGGMSGGNADFLARNLSLNQRPYAININSGIKHNAYGKVRLDADDYGSPLHVTTVKFQLPNAGSDPRFLSWWSINITNKFQTLAQRRVGFNTVAETLFSSANLLVYYSAIARALMTYYAYAKPLIYSPANRNDGVTFWRKNLGPADLDLLMQLRDAINLEPIPPFLNAWLFQLYGVYYRTSMNPNSALWTLHPDSLGTATGTVFQTMGDTLNIQNALMELTSPTFRNTSNMVARVFPDWAKNEMVFTTPTVAEFSPNMNTLFANLPFLSTNGYPRVESQDDQLVYNTYADSLDGLILASTGAYNTSLLKWVPSLMIPVGNDVNGGAFQVSRLSYSNLSGTEGMQWSGEFTRLAHSRGETVVALGSTVHAFEKFGTERVLGVTPNSVREISYLALEKLVGLTDMDVDRAMSSTAAEDASSDNSNSRGRRRRKRK
jgi:hypothetical protein